MIEKVHIRLGILDGVNRDGTSTSVIPIGDYAVDKEGNIFYNFKIDDIIYVGGTLETSIIYNALASDIRTAINDEKFLLKSKTLFYPISLI